MAAGADRRLRVIVTGSTADVIDRVVAELIGRGDHVVTAGEPADALLHVGGHPAQDAEELTSTAKAAGIPRVIAVYPGSAPRQARRDGLLRIWIGYVLGNASTGESQRLFGGPVIFGVRGSPGPVRIVHHDDVARFVWTALHQPGWRGDVTLSAADPVPAAGVAAALGKPYAEVGARLQSVLPGWLGAGAIIGSAESPGTVAATDLGFTPVYESLDCLRDFRRANYQHVYLGRLRLGIPWRFPWLAPAARQTGPNGAADRHPANLDGLAGEFDTTVNPRYPAFTCANVAEAFPGPMTPLSLELAMAAMRATGLLAADIVSLKGELRRAVTDEQVGSFGHTIYVNLTVSDAASAMLPGASASAWRDLLFGAESGVDDALSDSLNPWSIVLRLPKIAILLGGAIGESRRIAAEVRSGQRGPGYYAACSDDELRSRLRWAHDDVVNSWAVAALASAGVVPIMGVIEHIGGKRLASGFRGGTRNLASAGLMLGTYDLARRARQDPSISELLRTADPESAFGELRSAHPAFAGQIDRVIAEYGHRGPGETELANPVFVDTPGRFVDAIAKLAGMPAHLVGPAPRLNPALRVLAGLGAEFQQARERVRDAAMRHTHTYRLIARELGARLAGHGVLDAPDDVFYLVPADLDKPPNRLRELVAQRRDERRRLEHCRPPTHFVSYWSPQNFGAGAELAPGESLTGIAASAGSAKGRVRILTADTLDELRAGEVLVAAHTDTGWTPFFCHAAAVVVDTGAQMSHAAVLAREFGIPCVVGAVDASRLLQTGHLVDVDGSAGRVIRLE